jgi:hypothetical protein
MAFAHGEPNHRRSVARAEVYTIESRRGNAPGHGGGRRRPRVPAVGAAAEVEPESGGIIVF